jgi:glycyl-tRNA synthetase beta chain
VLAGPYRDPADALARCGALQKARDASAEVFEDLSVAYKRAANLLKEADVPAPEVALMGEHERSLSDALDDAASSVDLLLAERDYPRLLEVYAGLRPAIDSFFDNVLVMDEDLKLRTNRLGLLSRFVDGFSRFADFERLA